MTSKNITTLKIVFGSFILLGAGIGAGFGIASITNGTDDVVSESKERIYSYDEDKKLVDVTNKYIAKDTVLKDYVSRKEYLEESYLLPKDEFKVNQLYVVVRNKVRSETQIENKLVEAELNILTNIKTDDVVKLTPSKEQNRIDVDVDVVTNKYVSKESLITDQIYIGTEMNGVKDLETFQYSSEYVNVNTDEFTLGDVYVIQENTDDKTRKALVKSNNYLNFDDITTEGLYKKVVGDGETTISTDLSEFYVEKTKLSGTNIYIKDIDDNVKVADKNIVFVKQPTTTNHITVGSVAVGNTDITFSSEYFYFYEREDSRKELKNFVLDRGGSKTLYGVFSTTQDDNRVYYRFKLKITRSSETTTDSFTIGLDDGVTEYRTKEIERNTIRTDRVYYDSFPDTPTVQLDSNSNLVINANNFVNLKEHVNSKV